MLTLENPLIFFSDVILRGPTLASILMCLSAALLGVILFLKKQSLLGETLSHAGFPGVMLAVLFSSLFLPQVSQWYFELWVVLGAFVSCFVALLLIDFLRDHFSMKEDTALAFVLSSFFGLGIFLASRMQFAHTLFYRKAQSYLLGQTVTMTDTHVYLYAALFLVVLLFILLFFKEIQTTYFDRAYATSCGIRTYLVNGITFFLVLLTVVLGIRCVGVVLMSAMFIAPVVAARQMTHKLAYLFLWASVFAILSGFLGNYLSVELSRHSSVWLGSKLIFPTGPLMALISCLIALLALFCSPERGMLSRIGRILAFRHRIVKENILKTLYYSAQNKQACQLDEIRKFHGKNPLLVRFILWQLLLEKAVCKEEKKMYQLTQVGSKRALRIIRLHRLWELYLVQKVGMGERTVHQSAELIEHILTPDIEKQLDELLDSPSKDPHESPIPRLEETL